MSPEIKKERNALNSRKNMFKSMDILKKDITPRFPEELNSSY